jgi:electron transfer flavoprotein beta subunit
MRKFAKHMCAKSSIWKRLSKRKRFSPPQGVDRGIHIKHDGELLPLAIAKALKAVCDTEKPDVVILGKQAIDGDSNQTGQMLGI